MIFAGAGFSNINLENMKISSSLSKILEIGINVFKSNSKIMKNTKYYEISTIYECVEKFFEKKPMPPFIFREYSL